MLSNKLVQVFHKRQFCMLQCLNRTKKSKRNLTYFLDVSWKKSTVFAVERHK